ncbi:hypothetical protein DPMN_110512 [Dreissena polymorpha]|uniref:Uncharacterized protein n=1 Tax=Dreissena polymorpha TaxID=45954 RepID=A0A9D4QN62_DREPO|nr:hypothetical protein DPMN_110512 [Dreissena polymorpha]
MYLGRILDNRGSTDADVRTYIGKARTAFRQLKIILGARPLGIVNKACNAIVKPTRQDNLSPKTPMGGIIVVSKHLVPKSGYRCQEDMQYVGIAGKTDPEARAWKKRIGGPRREHRRRRNVIFSYVNAHIATLNLLPIAFSVKQIYIGRYCL